MIKIYIKEQKVKVQKILYGHMKMINVDKLIIHE